MFLLRLLIVGDTHVGKTSLLLRFNEGYFIANQKTTVGVDFKAKEVDLDGQLVKLQIWDTAGQERFRSMTSAFYTRAQGVVLVFDVSQRETFDKLHTWISDVRGGAPANTPIILCAGKVDLPKETWRVSKEEYDNFASNTGLKIIETSSSTGHNVDALFKLAALEIMSSCKESGVHLAQVVASSRGGGLSPVRSIDGPHSTGNSPKIVLDESYRADDDKLVRERKNKEACCVVV